MAWAFSLEIPPNEKLLLLCFADHADEEGWCFPGQEKLAKKASMSVATVRRLTAKLEERELLFSELRYSSTTGFRTSSGYRLPLNLSGRPTAQSEGAYRSTVSGRENHQIEPSVNTKKRASMKQPMTTDWLPSEADVAWAKALGNSVPHLQQQTERFVNHYLSTGDERATWGPAWRNWISRPASGGGARAKSAPRDRMAEMESVIEIGRRLDAEAEGRAYVPAALEGL